MSDLTPRSDSSDRIPTTPKDLHPTSDIRFVMIELGKLTERIEGLKESNRGANRLQIAAIVVVLLSAAFGAWGISSQLAAANARIDRLEDRLAGKLDRLDERVSTLSERLIKLEPRH